MGPDGELVACRDTEDSSQTGHDPALAFETGTGVVQAWDTGGRYGAFRVEARVR